MDEFVVSTWPLLKPFFHPTHEPAEGVDQPAATPAPAQDQEPQEQEELTEEELAAGEVDPADLVTPAPVTREEPEGDEVGRLKVKFVVISWANTDW